MAAGNEAIGIKKSIITLFSEHFGEKAEIVQLLPASGSERRYFRIKGASHQAIGAYHPAPGERKAFIALSHHFLKKGLPVPEIYHQDEINQTYLLEDLGDDSLFSRITASGGFNSSLEKIYQRVLEYLIRFQVEGAEGLDFSLCYPRPAFDRQSISWDLQYFKYYFLKPQVLFDDQKLEDDFERLMDFLEEAPADHFMYRDFQSRNIFIRDDTPWFIDYQGGRKGPLQYDLASLLFQVKAAIPPDFEIRLREYYLEQLQLVLPKSKDNFMRYYPGFVLIRFLQVLGAYGFRGLIQQKPHFLSSIPPALGKLAWWLEQDLLPLRLPELNRCLNELITKWPGSGRQNKQDDRLTVDVFSFSYKDGIPHDESGNGGGFVFDCRGLPNPGREEKYRPLTGKDHIIEEYFGRFPEVRSFIDGSVRLVEQTIDNYLSRGFSHLMVAFGCTGGQHRSVYCAERFTRSLAMKYRNVEVRIRHSVLEKVNRIL